MSQNALALAPVGCHQSVGGPSVIIIVPTPAQNNNLLLHGLLESLLHNYSHRRDGGDRFEASRADFLMTSYSQAGYLVRAFYPRCKDPTHRGATAVILIDIFSSEQVCVLSAFNEDPDPRKDIVSAYQAEITQEALWLYRSMRSLFRTAGYSTTHRYVTNGEDGVRQNIMVMKPSSNHECNLANHMKHLARLTIGNEVSINEITDLYYGQITSQRNNSRLLSDSRPTAARGGGRRDGRRGGRGGGHIRGDGVSLRLDIQTHRALIRKSLYMMTDIQIENRCHPGTARKFLIRLAQQASTTFEKSVTHTYWTYTSYNSIRVVRRLDQPVTDCGVNEWYTYVQCSPQTGSNDPASEIFVCAFNPDNAAGNSRSLTIVERDYCAAFRLMCERAASDLAARFTIPMNLTLFNTHHDVHTEEARVAMVHLLAPVYCWNGAIVLEIVYDRVAAAVAAADAAAATDAAADAAAAAARAALMPRRAPSSGGRLSLQQLSLQPR